MSTISSMLEAGSFDAARKLFSSDLETSPTTVTAVLEKKPIKLPIPNPAGFVTHAGAGAGASPKICTPSPEKRSRKRSGGTPLRIKRRIARLTSGIKQASGLKNFQELRRLFEQNSQLTEMIMSDILAKRSKKLPEIEQKKCFTACGYVVFELDSGGVAYEKSSSIINKTFWSSAMSKKTVKGAEFIGVDKPAIAEVLGRVPHPLSDHHSERAALMWIDRNITNLLPADLEITDKTVILFNFYTSKSSCPRCARLFGGSGDGSTRVSDALRGKISKNPHVVCVLQGAEPYSAVSKSAKTDAKPEFYCSQSLFDEIVTD